MLQTAENNLLMVKGQNSDEMMGQAASEARDMGHQILDMVNTFALEAKENSHEEN